MYEFDFGKCKYKKACKFHRLWFYKKDSHELHEFSRMICENSCDSWLKNLLRFHFLKVFEVFGFSFNFSLLRLWIISNLIGN